MTEAEELEFIDSEVEKLGRQIEEKANRALEILRGRIAHAGGNRFRVTRAHPYFGGMSCRLFFKGPVLKQNGEPHARNEESRPLRMIDKIEPRQS